MTSTKPKFLRKILWSILVVLLALSQAGAATVFAQNSQNSALNGILSFGGSKGGKLSSRLAILAGSGDIQTESVENLARTLSLPAEGGGSLAMSADGRLVVDIRVSDPGDEQLQAISDAGAEISHVSTEYRMVTASVAAADLNAIAALPFVENVGEVLNPVINGHLEASTQDSTDDTTCPWGSATSEGDSQLKAALARSTYSLDGSGVKVGVLSDSYNKSTNAIKAANDIASGDLPGVGNPCGYTTPVSVLSDYGSTGSDEGRAMLQIVHDLAPAASLSFATAFEDLYSFADNITALRSAGADIIVDDVYYYSEPFYQEGPVSVAIKGVVNSGGLYFTSAGNDNEAGTGKNAGSLEMTYTPTACPTLGGSTMTGDCNDFNTSSGVDTLSGITLAGGASIVVNFQWAEPWYGVTDDFDIYLVDNTANHTALAGSDELNTGSGGSQMPFEIFGFTNPSSSAQTYNIVINRFSGSGTPKIKYQFVQPAYDITNMEYDTSTAAMTVGPTLFGHSASAYSMSVAAARYNDAQDPEYFSTHGPATHYFGEVTGTTPAAALSTPQVLQQPNFTATDGVCTTFFAQSFDWQYALLRHVRSGAARSRGSRVVETKSQSDEHHPGPGPYKNNPTVQRPIDERRQHLRHRRRPDRRPGGHREASSIQRQLDLLASSGQAVKREIRVHYP